MQTLEAAHYIARELVKEKAKIVILSGSAARDKENPKDLDIAAVFQAENRLLDRQYRSDLVKRLESEVGQKLDLFDFNERNIERLIEFYNKNPIALCSNLNWDCIDNVKDQWKGWPLAWIMGDKAREALDPYGCFQDEFIVLEGESYLAELRGKVKVVKK
ncbi:MAG: nucleotidyltransferase domain-containing protein [archaeon]